jgi:hypothetical protein
VDPYDNTPAAPRPWWRTTPAALGVLLLVAPAGAFVLLTVGAAIGGRLDDVGTGGGGGKPHATGAPYATSSAPAEGTASPGTSKEREATKSPAASKMPDLVGKTYEAAVKDLKRRGIDPDRATLGDVYLDLEAPSAKSAAAEGDEWHVCFQSPDKGGEVASRTAVHLDLGKWTGADTVRSCPATKDTTYKDPANDPANDPDHGGTSGGGSTSGGGGGGGPVVHPGAYCSPAGAVGVTKEGTPMVCGRASDGRNRLHSM